MMWQCGQRQPPLDEMVMEMMILVLALALILIEIHPYVLHDVIFFPPSRYHHGG